MQTRWIVASFLFQFAAVVCAQSGDVLRVTISPELIRDDGKTGLHWKLATLPGENDVLLTDVARKAKVVEIIDKLPETHPQCNGVFYADAATSATSCSLIRALSSLINFDPGPYHHAPTAGAPHGPMQVVLKGAWIPPLPVPVIGSLCIIAATGAYAPTNCTDPDPRVVSRTLDSLASTNHLGVLPPELAKILIRVRAEDNSSDAVSQLLAVSANVFRIARAMNVLPGFPIPEDTAGKIDNAITNTYMVASSQWQRRDLKPIVTILTVGKSADYMLEIQNLHMMRNAAIVLTRATEVGPQTPEIEKALTERRQAVACTLEHQFRRELSSIVGTIPTSDEAWQVADAIGKSDEVVGAVIPQPPSEFYKPCEGDATHAGAAADRMEFTATRRAVVARFNGTLTLGINASSHEILTGTGQLTESHMLLQRSEKWADTGSLNLNGGPEVQTANASFGIGRSIGQKQTLDFGVDVDGLYLRDQNQRYGYLAGPKFVDQEYGGTPNAYATFNRPASLDALSTTVKISLGQQFRYVELEPPPAYPTFVNHGWVIGFNPTLSIVEGYDFTHPRTIPTSGGGVGQIFVSIAGDFLAARRAAGGDFSFNRYSLNGAAEMFFGVTGTNDFLLRYGRGVNTSSSGTPLFELPRAGGSANIRGIEQGEYVGRGLGFEQSEAAVNGVSVWKWIHRRPAAAPPNTEPANGKAASGNGLAGLGITGIFVGGIYDRAKIGQSSKPGDLLDMAHGFHGAGGVAEVRGLPAGGRHMNIGFIYSVSPDSVLHPKGAFITSVSLDF